MFSPLDQILVDEELPEINDQLMKLTEMTNLHHIANKRGILHIIVLNGE